MEFSGEPETHALSSSADFKNHQDYLYAIDLINGAYYWECHAYLEALWNAHGRKDDFAVLFKAIIKIAAGLLKREMKQESACTTHLQRALELIDELPYESFCGVELAKLRTLISHMLSKPLEPLPDLIIELSF